MQRHKLVLFYYVHTYRYMKVQTNPRYQRLLYCKVDGLANKTCIPDAIVNSFKANIYNLYEVDHIKELYLQYYYITSKLK